MAYVTAASGTVRADLGSYFDSLLKAGVRVMHVIAGDTGRLSAPEPYSLRAPSFSGMGFFRSSAGGFGAPVPHPSSGG